MSKSSVGSGNIEITILGEDYTLVPTLRAAKTLSSKYGGGLAAAARLGQMDIEVIIDIIALGLSLTPNGMSKFADEKGLEQAVWENGLFDLSGKCIKYVHILMNGGKPVGEDIYSKDAAPLTEND